MVAYFSMAIGIDKRIPTYSGGLGILAGDTMLSAADLEIPLIGVTLIHHKGYFKQRLREDGTQEELPDEWNPDDVMELLPHRVSVGIGSEKILIGVWKYEVEGISGFKVPIYFLDTNLFKNSPENREITHYLYGGDKRYRLKQEIVLGVGGVRILKELGIGETIYHMNESHSALIIHELLKKISINDIKNRCLFTIHTPIPAGHDKFDSNLVKEVLPEWKGELDMTRLAFDGSGYVNGVSKRHRDVSRQMFKRDDINGITNGIHSVRWTSREFIFLYDRFMPGWREESALLKGAERIPASLIWSSHIEAKKRLLKFVKSDFNIDTFTIGFARRFVGYKRADLIMSNPERFRRLGDIQIIFSGKAHPQDTEGKKIIKRVIDAAKNFKGEVKVTYLENYNIKIAKLLTQGVDLWLNNPEPPLEACGTSGMKAAHNGIPSLSTLDGWWLEGCKEGVTGWSLDDDGANIYDKLEKEILPLFYNNKEKWIEIMKNTISMNASYFNTHRMIHEYNKIYKKMESNLRPI
ncbi:alpha-glucan family phosphorylase [candidate division WOR-3 bacterium]|nr:alpha-glucan family phosphorylase [candidate division WOR-3 bacterium]